LIGREPVRRRSSCADGAFRAPGQEERVRSIAGWLASGAGLQPIARSMNKVR
jgi:hypothetical protein